MRKLSIICVLFLFGVAFPAAEISSCQVLNASGEYVLSADLHGADVYASVRSDDYACISVESSHISLDCNGHTLALGTSHNKTRRYGIWLQSSVANVTIKNCIVSGYYCGICGGPHSSAIANNTLYANADSGISLAGHGNLISGNKVHDGVYAIAVNYANDSIVANNEVY